MDHVRASFAAASFAGADHDPVTADAADDGRSDGRSDVVDAC